MGAATPQIAYTASKGGVLSMTREIAVEYARQGIRANALCPGPIETPLLAELMSDPSAARRRLVHIPMGRLGRAEELAKAALFLASDDSSFMTGVGAGRRRRHHRGVRHPRVADVTCISLAARSLSSQPVDRAEVRPIVGGQALGSPREVAARRQLDRSGDGSTPSWSSSSPTCRVGSSASG